VDSAATDATADTPEGSSPDAVSPEGSLDGVLQESTPDSPEDLREVFLADGTPLDEVPSMLDTLVPKDTAPGEDAVARDAVTPMDTIPLRDTAVPLDTVRVDLTLTDTAPRTDVILTLDAVPLSDAPTDAPAPGLFTQVAAGLAHTCGIAHGRVYCWGRNDQGQLGDGTLIDRVVPTAVALAGTPLRVAAGGGHSCALTATGELFCWGDNTAGQLGVGDTTDSDHPRAVSLAGVLELSLGAQHSCARLSSGAVACWGDNTYGAVGDGSRVRTIALPTTLRAVTDVLAVSAGDGYTCATVRMGTCTGGLGGARLYCWGRNNLGQLGLGAAVDQPSPVLVPDPDPPCASSYRVAAGTVATLAMRQGDLSATGRNDRMLFGAMDPRTALSFTLTAGLAAFYAEALGVGSSHACALLLDWTAAPVLSCWGDNTYGQLGVGPVGTDGAPTTLPFFGTAAMRLPLRLAVGGFHTCAIASATTAAPEGELYCWGRNTYGQLGNPDLRATIVPTRVRP
jgi:alpha-tubulin suppressor-like RCC1 family protein